MQQATYVFDACSLIALLNRETGGEEVRQILRAAARGEVSAIMHKLNLLEVYYGYIREHGAAFSGKIISHIKKIVTIMPEIDDDIFTEAGRLKAAYKISLADAVCLALASVSGGSVVTADHHEFDAVERGENISFHWIR